MHSLVLRTAFYQTLNEVVFRTRIQNIEHCALLTCIYIYCYIVGDHLEVCPHGSTCCTRDMESKLKDLSAREYSKIVGEAFRYAKSTFVTRTRKFDGKYMQVKSSRDE